MHQIIQNAAKRPHIGLARCFLALVTPPWEFRERCSWECQLRSRDLVARLSFQWLLMSKQTPKSPIRTVPNSSMNMLAGLRSLCKMWVEWMEARPVAVWRNMSTISCSLVMLLEDRVLLDFTVDEVLEVAAKRVLHYYAQVSAFQVTSCAWTIRGTL